MNIVSQLCSCVRTVRREKDGCHSLTRKQIQNERTCEGLEILCLSGCSIETMDLNFRQEASAEFWIVFWENARKHIRNKNTAHIYLYVNCKSCARATRVAAIFMTSTNVIAKISSSKSIKLPVVFQWDLLHCSQLKTSQVLCHRNDRGKANTPNLD